MFSQIPSGAIDERGAETMWILIGIEQDEKLVKRKIMKKMPLAKTKMPLPDTPTFFSQPILMIRQFGDRILAHKCVLHRTHSLVENVREGAF